MASLIGSLTGDNFVMTVINQPRGVEITYRVSAVNTNGPGPSVASEQVVL
jgi:hypothetical protein